MPRILATDDEDEDDLEAWSGLTNRQPRWREGSDWEEADFDDDSLLADERDRMGALDEHREDRDVFSFGDEEVFDDEPRRARPPPVRRRPASAPASRPSPSTTANGGSNGPRRGRGPRPAGRHRRRCRHRPRRPARVPAPAPAWAAAFATIIVLLAAAEVFDVFRRSGYKPATLLGLVATGSLMVGAYVRGERAIPLVLALTVMFSMLWYLFGVVKARPALNLGITMLERDVGRVPRLVRHADAALPRP